jgi:HEAT repeat protein
LKGGSQTPGHAYLLNLLVENDLLPQALANDAEFSFAEAVDFVTIASRIDPLLDTKLARWTLNRLRGESAERATPAARRILNILERTSTSNRLASILVQLLRIPDPAIRSKAALLLGRGTRGVRWALGERDPRVRANAVEAVWGVDSKGIRKALWQLAKDSNNRVAGNALLGLYSLGEEPAMEGLLRMSEHSFPRFRATAAWVMGQTQDPSFLEALHRLEKDRDAQVQRNASLALARIDRMAAPEAEIAQ